MDMLVTTSCVYLLLAVLEKTEEDWALFPGNKKHFNYFELFAHSIYNLIYGINKGMDIVEDATMKCHNLECSHSYKHGNKQTKRFEAKLKFVLMECEKAIKCKNASDSTPPPRISLTPKMNTVKGKGRVGCITLAGFR